MLEEPDVAESVTDEPLSSERIAEAQFFVWLVREGGFQDVKPLTGRPGYWAGLYRLMFHWSIQGGQIGDKIGVPIRYCYGEDELEAKEALDAWDGEGEPVGWHRHPATGRRRYASNPDLEYFEP